MSAAPQLCAAPCETCAKEDLALLLARYALMPSEAKAPRIDNGPLNAPELAKVPLGPGAHYGVRLLRSGYVYAFDEARNHWDEYFVTSDGYLSKLPPRIRAFVTRPKPATEFACARNGVAPMAGVITIRKPKHATKVWLSFSDVEWTDAVLQKHQDAVYRQQHMHCITVTAGKVAPQPRVAPIDELDQWLPEFAMEPKPARDSFGAWCPHVFNSRKEQASSLKSAVAKARPQGGAAIVALHDPAGLAMELGALMEVRKQVFLTHPGVERPRAAAGIISSLEFSLKEQAKLDEILAGEALARMAEQGPAAYNPNPALYGVPGDYEAAERLRTHDPRQLEQIAERKWREYTHTHQGTPRFDTAGSQQWLAEYDQRFQAFDAEQIAPLAQAHAAWMKHRCMVSHMSCNYDPADLPSGAAYTAVVGRMMRFTSDKQPSYDLYLQWLKDGQPAAGNLVMRALCFNQDDHAKAIATVERAELDGRAFPSDAVITAAKDALVKLLPLGAQASLGAVLDGLSGAVLRYWNDFNTGKAGPRAAAALAAATGQQVVRVPVVGRRDQFVQAFVKQVYRLDPHLKANHNQLGKAVAAQVKLLGIEGLPMHDSDKRGWYVLLDQEVARMANAKGLTGDALAREVAKAIHRPEDLQKLDVVRWKHRIEGSGVGLASGMLGGLLQAYNFTKLVADYQNAMSHEGREPLQRLAAGVMAISGTLVEAMGNGLQTVAGTRLRNAMGLGASTVPDTLKLWGRRLGFAAGAFVGVLDVMKGIEEGASGDRSGLSMYYFVSGGLGFGISAAFYFSSLLGPIGWVVTIVALLALFVITAVIEKNKDNKLQEWLSRCYFGKGTDKYPDGETEQKQYELVFA